MNGFLSVDVGLARRWLTESVRLHEESGNQQGRGQALASLGTVHFLLRDWEGARSLLKEALASLEAVPDEWGQGLCRTYLGIVESAAGNAETARPHFREALRILESIRDLIMLTVALVGQAELIAGSDPSRALRVTAAREASELARLSCGAQEPDRGGLPLGRRG